MTRRSGLPSNSVGETATNQNSARRALLLRVGMDRGTGGALGPIFHDGAFEYIPIPESARSLRPLTYAELPGRHVRSLALVLPSKLAGFSAHIDPDFDAWTYGDAAPRKRAQLLRLSQGDLLLFYAGLAPAPPDDRARLFVIGSLTVRRVHALRACDLARPNIRRFAETAHFLRRPPDEELALIEGEPGEGGLFQKALPLGDGRDRMLRDLSAIGYGGSLLRAVGHWIEGARSLDALESWLAHGPAGLVSGDTRLVEVSEAALGGGVDGEDLTIEDARLREGDFVVARCGESRVRALGRINRAAAGLGACSLFWLFDGEAPRYRSPGGAPAPLTRTVAWFAQNYRIGFHRL